MTDNFSNDENALFKAQIRKADLAANQKLQEIQGAADEFARQAIINKLRQAEAEHEELKLKLAREASDRVDNILSYVELSAAENEENFTSGIDGLLAKLFKFFNFMDSELGVETDPQVYRMIKKREEESWIAAIIKFLRDKFNKLIKAIFSRDLSFGKQIDKEIGKLFERLFGGNLSQEEEAAILERLEALRDLKLKLQMFVAGSVITVFAELLSVELTASVETTKEEGKEKASAKEKEATKEVHENLEIKVDAKEKPTVIVPVSLFDFSSGVAKPITLTKQELDLLPKPLANLVHRVQEYATSKENSGVPKQEEKEKQGQENKKATQPAPKPVAAPSPAPKQSAKNTMGPGVTQKISGVSNKKKRDGGINGKEVPTIKSTNVTRSANKQKMDDLCDEFAKELANFKVGDWNGAEHELQQSSVNNAQENPKSKFTDVVNERVGQSVGKASGMKSRTM